MAPFEIKVEKSIVPLLMFRQHHLVGHMGSGHAVYVACDHDTDISLNQSCQAMLLFQKMSMGRIACCIHSARVFILT